MLKSKSASGATSISAVSALSLNSVSFSWEQNGEGLVVVLGMLFYGLD
jgi:hypothetical protein